MEQLLTFFLGALSVVTIISIAIALKIRKEIQDYRNQDEDIKMQFESDFWNAIDGIDRRIDQEIDRTDSEIRRMYDTISNIKQK